MKKNLITTVTTLALAVASANAFADVELRMSWWGGNERHQATNAALERFQEKYPDISVKGEYTGWDGHLSRLTTQIAGNTEPDVMQTNWNWMPIFSKDGSGFYDMTSLSKELGVSNFPEASIEMSTNAGKLNGLPVSMTSRVFYFNKDSWEKAGLSYPKNWDELMNAGPVFKEKLGEKYYPLVIEARDVFAMNRSYMIQKYNKDIIGTDGMLQFDQKEMTEFFQLYADQVKNHVFPSSKEFASYGRSNLYEMRPWIEGEFGGVYMWDSAIAKYSDNLKPPMQLELADYPMVDGATDAGLLSRPSMMFSIGRNTEHPEEAAKLVNFLLNDPDGVKALGLSRSIPLSKSGLNTLTETGQLDKNSLQYRGYQQALDVPKKIVATPYTDNAQLMEMFSEEMQHIDYGKATPEEAAKSFLRKGNRLLKKLTR
ncbi:ABC transporter substrate-binding protein [Vibrio litoralis]|uniref:ABC transporter substrate-binding protein n=1 Tax=Vibrio litoralis TaxID=335972 RepID=UPI00041DD48B|nr:ABC transporter substrate-binding protein [Vibrio litoralis]